MNVIEISENDVFRVGEGVVVDAHAVEKRVGVGLRNAFPAFRRPIVETALEQLVGGRELRNSVVVLGRRDCLLRLVEFSEDAVHSRLLFAAVEPRMNRNDPLASLKDVSRPITPTECIILARSSMPRALRPSVNLSDANIKPASPLCEDGGAHDRIRKLPVHLDAVDIPHAGDSFEQVIEDCVDIHSNLPCDSVLDGESGNQDRFLSTAVRDIVDLTHAPLALCEDGLLDQHANHDFQTVFLVLRQAKLGAVVKAASEKRPCAGENLCLLHDFINRDGVRYLGGMLYRGKEGVGHSLRSLLRVREKACRVVPSARVPAPDTGFELAEPPKLAPLFAGHAVVSGRNGLAKLRLNWCWPAVADAPDGIAIEEGERKLERNGGFLVLDHWAASMAWLLTAEGVGHAATCSAVGWWRG